MTGTAAVRRPESDAAAKRRHSGNAKRRRIGPSGANHAPRPASDVPALPLLSPEG